MCTRELDGEAVEFGTSGYTMDHVFVLYDRSTESIWYPLSDETLDAVAGSRNGESIAILDEPAPVVLSEWLASHPDSSVLLPSEADAEMLERARNAPYMGVRLAGSDAGLEITSVETGTPAETAGLIAGDLFVRIGEAAIPDQAALQETMGDHLAGDVITVVVLRGDEELQLELTLGHRPE
ncbi:MAG: membrane-associated protease RseP (regulator of RpoE activity) [Planctomycetota bacterium]